MPAKINNVGLKFALLTVVSQYYHVEKKAAVCIVSCDCGSPQFEVWASSLRFGNTKSCGCIQRNKARAAMLNPAGPRSRRKVPIFLFKTQEAKAFYGMRNRCYNKKGCDYKYWGGRGVRICEGWSTLEAFYKDMAPMPTLKHTIDRIDNDGHYSCGHCEQCIRNGWPKNTRWATRKEQNENKSSANGYRSPLTRLPEPI